jgi:hypothetical protein
MKVNLTIFPLMLATTHFIFKHKHAYSLKEVQVLAERWRVHDNTIRPHSSLGYRSPAPEAWAQASVSKPPPSSIAHHSVERIFALDNAFSLIDGTKDRADHNLTPTRL